MKRSAGVTVASISVVAASALYCLHVFYSLPPVKREGFGILMAGSIFALGFAAWGIATGVGLLRLRRWAWLCVLTFSVVIILFAIPQLLGAPRLIRATTGVLTVSSGHFISHEYFESIGLGLVPFALGVWWVLFFTRRSVRLQFAAVLTAREETIAPPHSDAVNIAAIVLFIGSALLLLLAVIMSLTALGPPPPGIAFPFRGMLIGIGFLYLLISAWGFITGVAVIQRRPWGRILMIVTGALGVAFSVLGSFGVIVGTFVTQSTPQMPPSAARGALITGSAIVGIPLGISIWWLVLFTRPRVTLEFAAPSVDPAPVLLAATVPQQEFTPAPHASFAMAEIPLSIRIVAVVEILFAALRLFGPLYSQLTNLKVPILVFGFLVHGWGVNAFYILSAIIPIVFCVAIFRRKFWGLDALAVFLLAEMANLALMIVSPARVRLNAELEGQMQRLMGQMSLPQGSPPPFPFAHVNQFQDIAFGISILFYAAMFYFLLTRRKAFRAACAARPEAAQ